MVDVTGPTVSGSVSQVGPPEETFRGAVTDRVTARGLGRGVLFLGLFSLVLLYATLSILGTGRTVLFVTYLVLTLTMAACTAYVVVLWRDHADHVPDDVVPGASRVLPGLRGAGALPGRFLAARRRGWTSAGAAADEPVAGSLDPEPSQARSAAPSTTAASAVPVAVLPGSLVDAPAATSAAEDHGPGTDGTSSSAGGEEGPAELAGRKATAKAARRATGLRRPGRDA